jgi:hypothetical protein
MIIINMTTFIEVEIRIEIGNVLATGGVIDLLDRTGTNASDLIGLHRTGNWGVLPPADIDANEHALLNGGRLLSAYQVGDTAQIIWLITEADRSVTSMLLPEEY